MATIRRNIYIIGIFLAIVLGVVCSLTLTKNSEEILFNKNTLESYYNGSNVDFIVPGPTKEQIVDIKKSENNGIQEIVPYYSFTMGILINAKNASGVGYVFQTADELNNTPYNVQRIIKGKKPQIGEAVVDYTFMKKNKCKIGDTVSLVYDSKELKYNIVAVAESNLEFTKHSGTVAIIIKEEDNQLFTNNKLKYSGAFVKSGNYEKCLNYLRNEYKPLSRLKDRESFDSDEAYQLHVDKFNAYDWMKETTDFQANYKSLSVKYENATKNVLIYQIIEAIIIIIAFLAFVLLALYIKSHKNNMDIFMRKNKDASKLVKMFSINNIVISIIFTAIFMILAVFLIDIERSFWQNPYLIVLLIPVIIAWIMCVINICFTSSVIHKRYKKNR